MKVGILEHIDCAHFLPGHQKCGVMHGHTYRIEVAVEGDVQNGMVVDFSELKTVVRAILAVYDHRSWNDFLEFPSVENICVLLGDRLRERVRFPFTLRVWEGDGKWAEL